MINSNCNIYQPNFYANLKSPKLNFRREDFFIKIHGYGRSNTWADIIIKTADDAVKSIRKKSTFNFVLKKITQGVIKANQIPLDLHKRERTGFLRIPRPGWNYPKDWNNNCLITRYDKKGCPKYRSYADRFDKIINEPLIEPYENISLTKPVNSNGEKYLRHGEFWTLDNALLKIESLYNHLINNFKGTSVNDEDLPTINNYIAEIRWILAHATPFERGSDAISNVLMKSLYKSFGIKTYPPAKNISFDLEAYCTNLKDYKKNFTNYFSIPPSVAK